MKIVILQGSPNRNGSTAILTEEFSRGAREAGHSITRYKYWTMETCNAEPAAGDRA